MHLVCHPATPSPQIEAIEVRFARQSGNRLWLRFHAEGPLDSFILPDPAHPIRTDGLWKTTCFEAFLRVPDMPAYVEFNLSPSDAWAAYRFDDYRIGRADLPLAEVPEIGCDASDSHFALEAVLALPPEWAAQPLALGLSAVIEEVGGYKSYWALAHPAGAPDFHHKDCFAAQLGAAGVA